jgi:hypothetical protein
LLDCRIPMMVASGAMPLNLLSASGDAPMIPATIVP